MTVLGVCQDVATVVGLPRPTAIFGSGETTDRQLAALSHEIAERIMEAHEWQALTVETTYTGTGSATSFPLPADYSRQLKESSLWSSRIDGAFSAIPSRDEWLEIITRNFEYTIGVWTIYDNQIHIRPTMATTETVRWFYISKNYALNGAAPIARFENDTDTFRLAERLLRLGMIWQWRANKGQPYAEDMESFEKALEEEISKDKGGRMIRVGRGRYGRRGTAFSYPRAIGV